MSDPARRWWGPLDVETEGAHRLAVGPLELVVERHEHAWRVRHRSDPDAPDDRLCSEAVPRSAAGASSQAEHAPERGVVEHLDDVTLRIGGETARMPLEVVALTADRPVVSLPVDPFVVPSGRSVRLFVSTPLWLALESGGERLCELPIARPSDTWVGANIGPGQAAYANRTQCRQLLSALPFRPHRAISPVRVTNRSRDALPLERVVLSVPFLSLHANDDGMLWTETIDVAIDDDGRIESEIGDEPPPEARATQPVSPARTKPPGGGLGRMLASVF